MQQRIPAVFTGLSLLSLVLGIGTVAQAQTLGQAANYNAFFLGDYNSSNIDIHGKLAVGGNATFSNYVIATQESSGSGVTTVIGGNYQNSGGTVYGSLISGGNVKNTNPSIHGDVTAKGSVDFSGGGGQVDGTINYGTNYTGPGYDINGSYATNKITPSSVTLPVDFAAAQTDLSNKSSYWATLNPNATNTGGNNVTVSLTTGLNVLNLTTTQLQNASSFNFTGGTNDILLINVFGSGSVTVPNTGTNFSGGMGFSNILYNFADPGLTAITLNGSFNGSLLATNAKVTATGGAFNGQLIAKSGDTGSLEIHKVINGQNTYFKGTLSAGNAVPEPGTLALLAGMLPLGIVLRRRVR